MNIRRSGATKKDPCEDQRKDCSQTKSPNAAFAKYRTGDNGLCAWTRGIVERHAHLKFDVGNEVMSMNASTDSAPTCTLSKAQFVCKS